MKEKRNPWRPSKYNDEMLDKVIEGRECTKCHLWKVKKFFSKDSRAKNKMQSICKDCEKKNREQRLLYMDEYRKKKKNIIAKKCREYYLSNKNSINSWRRKYYKGRGRMRILASRQKRRKRCKETDDGTIDNLFLQWLWWYQGGLCNVTGQDLRETGFHLDHIQPLSRGGKHTAMNVQFVTPFINLSKKDNYETN